MLKPKPSRHVVVKILDDQLSDYISSLDIPLKKDLVIISIQACELVGGKVTRWLIVMGRPN